MGGWDDVVIQGNPDELSFAAFFTRGETVLAVCSVAKDPVMTLSAELMRAGKMPSKSDLQNGLDILTVSPP